MQQKTATLHGRRVTYTEVGSGPVLLLIHGIAGSSENWHAVIEPLARRHTVIAPDLPGHGTSAAGAGDYSLGALAVGLRDLLIMLGHTRATLVGHSLGGGVAMELSYHFPELAERLVLVSSGGLGQEVSPVLRAAALPGAELFIAATARAATKAGGAVGRGLAKIGLRPNADVAEVARGYASLADHDRRAAFLATLRAVVSTRGQSVDASDRLYLAARLPVLILWGAQDPIIPAHHGQRAHEAIGGSRLEIFDGIGHMPQIEMPARFVTAVERFIEETEPARFDLEEWRAHFQTTDGEPATAHFPKAGGERATAPRSPTDSGSRA